MSENVNPETACVGGSAGGSSVPVTVDCPDVKFPRIPRKKKYIVIYPGRLGLVLDELPHPTKNYVLLSDDQKTLYAAYSYLPSAFADSFASMYIVYDVENDKVLVPTVDYSCGGPIGGIGGYDVYYSVPPRIAIISVNRGRSGRRWVDAPPSVPEELLNLIKAGDYVTIQYLSHLYSSLR